MIKALNCPNCNGIYNPQNSSCEYCGSYIIFTDKKNEEYEPLSNGTKEKKVYFNNVLLNDAEYPIKSGLSNMYYNVFSSDGGQLLLTNQRLLFVAHGLNINPNKTWTIDLQQVTDCTMKRNLFVSQTIAIRDQSDKETAFVVFKGKEWIKDILKTKETAY